MVPNIRDWEERGVDTRCQAAITLSTASVLIGRGGAYSIATPRPEESDHGLD